MFILQSRESDQSAITSSLSSCQPPVYHTKMGKFHYVPFPTAQQVNLPACLPHCPFKAERQAGKQFLAFKLSSLEYNLFQNDDFKSASNVVRSLIDMNYSECWKLCVKLAKRKEISDLKFR